MIEFIKMWIRKPFFLDCNLLPTINTLISSNPYEDIITGAPSPFTHHPIHTQTPTNPEIDLEIAELSS